MKRRTALRAAFGVTAAAALGGALTGDASSRRPGPRGILRLATGEPTAFYAAFGRLLAAELQSAHPGLSCRVRTTAGSITNIELIRDGRADLALVLTDTARAAQGTALFRRPVPLRAIGRVYETYLQFAVRADAPVRSMADLAGHPVSLGAPGSGAALLGERLLHAAGLTPGTDLPVRHLRLADAARELRSGSIVGLLVAGGVPLPTLTDLDADPGLRFLPWPACCPASPAPEAWPPPASKKWNSRRTPTGPPPASPPSACPTSSSAAPTSPPKPPRPSPASSSCGPPPSSPRARSAPSSSTSAA